MSSQINGPRETEQNGYDWSGLFGLLALLGLAFPALGIRYLYPDLDPLFLVALGGTVYTIYLAMLAHQMAQPVDMEPALEVETVETRDHLEYNHGGKSR